MPKRSAGCFECRKRKVRCDETKPECNTCLRRGTTCPGYRPTQSFILHKFNDQTERPAIIREDENRYRYANQQNSEDPDAADSNEGTVGHLKPGNGAHIVRQVSPIAIERVQHIGSFLDLFLPKTEANSMPPPSALMLALPSLPATSSALLAAIDALSAAQLAVNNRNYPLINRSRSLYGGALTQMLNAIQTPASAMEDETLLATYLLTLYEVILHVCSVALALTYFLGFCGNKQRPWLLLPRARSSPSGQTTRTSVFQVSLESANLSCHTIQLRTSSSSVSEYV
jgi:hypothetical protein